MFLVGNNGEEILNDSDRIRDDRRSRGSGDKQHPTLEAWYGPDGTSVLFSARIARWFKLYIIEAPQFD